MDIFSQKSFSFFAVSLGDATEHTSEHHPNSMTSDSGLRGGGVYFLFFFLYRGRPPPLAADATEVEGSHLHLHERDGELVAFPVIPVYALEGRREPFLEVAQLDDGKRGTGLSKGDMYRGRTEGSRLRGT